jgi:DNA polymerase III subunit epsilon
MIFRWLHHWHPMVKGEKSRSNALMKKEIPLHCVRLFEPQFPRPDTPLDQLDCVVLDFETSGLEPSDDKILSIGLVELRYPVMKLSSAQHYYVKSEQMIKSETAVINHIVPETLLGGIDPSELIERLAATLTGKIVIAHGAQIEKRFLRALLQLDDDVPLPLIFLDTLRLEQSLSAYRGMLHPDLRLSSIRERKGLPPYLAHNAFADSVATGELFLAIVGEIFAGQNPILGPLVLRSL